MRTLVISIMVAALVGGWLGYRLADGRCSARELTVARAYLSHAQSVADASREHAKAESIRRDAQALQDAWWGAAARDARLKGQIDARKEPVRPACDWPAERVRNANTAIDAANAADAATRRLPHGLPDVTKARRD